MNGLDWRCAISSATMRDDWTARIVADPTERQKQFRSARNTERLFSFTAAVVAMVAVWAFTAGTQDLGGIPASTVGGLGVVCFTASMAVAAGGGIRRRLILLIAELEARER